jgi:hypothetical protein
MILKFIILSPFKMKVINLTMSHKNIYKFYLFLGINFRGIHTITAINGFCDNLHISLASVSPPPHRVY